MKGGEYNASKGSRFMYLKPNNTRSGRTGRVITNINDEHILGEFNHPKTIEIIRKEYLNSMGEPCEKRCATCECIPYKTLRKNMPYNSISNKANHSVEQGEFAIKPVKLYTTALTTCSALMMDIKSDTGIMHFLAHIDGGESSNKINKMISSISERCNSKKPEECISNIKIWGGAGSDKEYGQYLNDPNDFSMPVVIEVLKGLDLIDVIDKKIYYKGTKMEIPVVKTCFRHYVGSS